MPNNLYQLSMGLVSFNEKDNEDVFLLYTPGFEEGPQIKRDGKREPWMCDPDNSIRYISDPLEQRKGVWFINPEIRNSVKQKVEKEIEKLKADLANETNKDRKQSLNERIRFREDFLKKVDYIKDYQTEFKALYGTDYEIVGMQGCGNLTMNEWYVAYVNSEFSRKFNQGSVILALPIDKGADPPREYTCFVKWKNLSMNYKTKYSIEKLIFNFYKRQVLLVAEENRKKKLTDITNEIEFAVYGTQVVENNEICDFREVVRQLADVRHAFRLPNVNPDDGGRPRKFFGVKCWGDVWFGEAEMLSNLALRRAAINEPVIFDCMFENMGMDREELALHLEALGYKRKNPFEVPNNRGEFRLRADRANWVEIFLHRNVYSYTMLGVGEQGQIAMLAVAGLAGRVGQTLEAATHNILSYMKNILRVEKVNALLIDQGEDVFQLVKHNNQLVQNVPPTRGQLRAVFVVGKKKNG